MQIAAWVPGVVLVVAVLYVRSRLASITVYEFERGLLYVRGQFRGLLDPGLYRVWTPTRAITKVDTRPRIASVPGQEVLTADGIAVKTSLVAQFRVRDPVVAVNQQLSYEAALHTELQLAIRRVLGQYGSAWSPAVHADAGGRTSAGADRATDHRRIAY